MVFLEFLFNYNCTKCRIVFQSSRSLIWIKDLLLHINPRILRLRIVSHLLSFYENINTKYIYIENLIRQRGSAIRQFFLLITETKSTLNTIPGLDGH